jgi:hypothetical protein
MIVGRIKAALAQCSGQFELPRANDWFDYLGGERNAG